MSNYASYNAYQDRGNAEEVYQTPSLSNTGGTTSVTVRDGEMVATTGTVSSVTSRELTPYAADDWRSTATKPNGSPATEITPDTIVTVNGIRGRVKDFATAGALVKSGDGYTLAEAAGEAQPQGDLQSNPDAAIFPQEIGDTIQAAAEPFPQYAYDNAALTAMHAATTGEGLQSITDKLARQTGMEPRDVAQRVEFIYDQYETQVSRYVTKNGIAQEDLQDFYEFCRGNQGEMLKAIQRQAWQEDLAGWKGLINKFQNNTNPSLKVLKENGFEVRKLGDEPEVRIGGMWMTPKQAAKAGLI